MLTKESPAGQNGGAGSGASRAIGGADTLPIVPVQLHSVKFGAADALRQQASAAEAREIALGRWHAERASSYGRWADSAWAQRRAAFHCDAARLHGQRAARHRAVRMALEGVRHG